MMFIDCQSQPTQYKTILMDNLYNMTHNGLLRPISVYVHESKSTTHKNLKHKFYNIVVMIFVYKLYQYEYTVILKNQRSKVFLTLNIYANVAGHNISYLTSHTQYDPFFLFLNDSHFYVIYKIMFELMNICNGILFHHT